MQVIAWGGGISHVMNTTNSIRLASKCGQTLVIAFDKFVPSFDDPLNYSLSCNKPVKYTGQYMTKYLLVWEH